MYRVKEAILGCSIGDAIGLQTKNINRDYLLDNPVLKMNKDIKKGYPLGTWSYNTSFVCSTCDSIMKNNLKYSAIIDRMIEWLLVNKYSSVNNSFGLDSDSIDCIIEYSKTHTFIKENENYNNTSLTMLLPVILYCYVNKKENLYEVIKSTTKIFHNNELSICGSYIFANLIINLLNNNDKNAAIKNLRKSDYSMFSSEVVNKYYRILISNIEELELDEIKSTDNIIDTLESSLWCFVKSDNFKDSVIAASNIGGDTSTIGAVTGILSGIYYGMNNIPKKWVSDLLKKDYLIELSDNYEKYLRVLSYETK